MTQETLSQLLKRGAAALKTAGSLTREERHQVAEDLTAKAKELRGPLDEARKVAKAIMAGCKQVPTARGRKTVADVTDMILGCHHTHRAGPAVQTEATAKHEGGLDTFLDDATHEVHNIWCARKGRFLTSQELQALNDALTAFFSGKEQDG